MPNPKKAIDLKEAVIPLSEQTMSDEDFTQEYGITKEQVNIALLNLSQKIK